MASDDRRNVAGHGYSPNGKIISHSYTEVAKALGGVKVDTVIDGSSWRSERAGSHVFSCFKTRCHEANLLYCAFDLMFENAADLRKQPLIKCKKRLKAILPRDKLIAFGSHHRAKVRNFSPRPSERA